MFYFESCKPPNLFLSMAKDKSSLLIFIESQAYCAKEGKGLMQSPQDSWYVQVNGQNYGPYNAAQMQAFCAEGRVNEYSIISQSAAQGYAPAPQFQSFLQWTGKLQTPAQSHSQPLHLTQTIAQTQKAQVLTPISAPQAGVLARQMTPNHAPQYVAPNPTPAQQITAPVQQPSPMQEAASIQNPLQDSAQHPQQHREQHPAPVQNTDSMAMTVFIVMAEIRSVNGMDFLQALQAHGTAQRIGDSLWLLQSPTSAVSYTHLPSPRDATLSRMPSSA